MTTQEAADKLELDVRRVQQFIKSGRLKATKPGRDWIITEEALQEFQDQPRKVGRPSKLKGKVG